MTPEDVIELAIRPALRLLPPAMTSRPAIAMLLAIGMQESVVFAHRRQMAGGPARGFWQFERGGGVRGVLEHAATRKLAAAVCDRLCYRPERGVVHTAIEHNDVLAAVFARLNLWWLSDPLPKEGDPDEGWRQYMAAWQPGKPHRRTWDAYFERAWALTGS